MVGSYGGEALRHAQRIGHLTMELAQMMDVRPEAAASILSLYNSHVVQESLTQSLATTSAGNVLDWWRGPGGRQT